MNRQGGKTVTALLLAVLLWLHPGWERRVQAQWVTQDIQLQTGWNSVYLEVDPSPADADQLFAGMSLESVWAHANRSVNAAPPVCSDPLDPNSGCVPPNESEWRVWLPPDRPGAFATTFRVVRGGQVLFIKATAATTLSLIGRPNASRTQWRQGFNLSGFHVSANAGAAPSFLAYLAPSLVHANPSVFEIVNGQWAKIADLANTRIKTGTGYWVSASNDGVYDGPVEIDETSLRGLDYAQSLVDYSLTIKNLAAAPRQVSLTYSSSAPVPPLPSDLPGLAGNVPLNWLDYGGGAIVTEVYQWRPLSSWPIAAAGHADDHRTLRIAVNRAGLAEASLDANGHGSQYQGVLEATDGAGYRRLFPASAQVSSRAGLWIGHVTVNAVSWVTAPRSGDADSTTPRPTSSEFTFPILVHKSAGAYKLLTEVTMMWRPGDLQTGQPGENVLVTPAAPGLLTQLHAGSIKDGQPFSRRISTAAFAFDGDLTLTGGFESVLAGATTIAANHRLNPFLHRYHPDHDGNQTGESFEVTRTFTLTFGTSPSPGVVDPGWGDSFLEGTYDETLKGLHREDIIVRGRFELRRVSQVATLNGQ